jgi:DNA-binding winged helix-turn-helix (wHTH) protein
MVLDSVDEEWRIGRYELRAVPGILMSGAEVIPLTPTDLRILLTMVRAGGQPVSKDALIAEIWGARPIGDGDLATYISRLRVKLGRGMIETIHGEGYRIAVDIEAAGSADEIFARYLARLLLEAEEAKQRTPDAEWNAAYLPRLDDVRRALDWSLARPGRRRFAIALAGSGARLFQRAGQVAVARSYADRALALIDDDARPADAAWLLHQAGILVRETDRPRSLQLFQRAESIYRQLRNQRQLGAVKAFIGGAYLFMGNYEAARVALIEAEKILRLTVQTKALVNALNDLGLLCTATGETAEAIRYFALARDLARMLGDGVREGVILSNLGEVEFSAGAMDRAVEWAAEAARLLRSVPSPYEARPLVNLATYEALRGNLGRARKHAAAALVLLQSEDGYWLRVCLQVWAAIALGAGRPAEAAKLIGFVDADFKRSGEVRQAAESQLYADVRRRLAASATGDCLAQWFSEGARWTESIAVRQVHGQLIAQD